MHFPSFEDIEKARQAKKKIPFTRDVDMPLEFFAHGSPSAQARSGGLTTGSTIRNLIVILAAVCYVHPKKITDVWRDALKVTGQVPLSREQLLYNVTGYGRDKSAASAAPPASQNRRQSPGRMAKDGLKMVIAVVDQLMPYATGEAGIRTPENLRDLELSLTRVTDQLVDSRLNPAGGELRAAVRRSRSATGGKVPAQTTQNSTYSTNADGTPIVNLVELTAAKSKALTAKGARKCEHADCTTDLSKKPHKNYKSKNCTSAMRTTWLLQQSAELVKNQADHALASALLAGATSAGSAPGAAAVPAPIGPAANPAPIPAAVPAAAGGPAASAAAV